MIISLEKKPPYIIRFINQTRIKYSSALKITLKLCNSTTHPSYGISSLKISSFFFSQQILTKAAKRKRDELFLLTKS